MSQVDADKSRSDPRVAGQTLMLYGLLWLIVYDACFVAGYVGYVPAEALVRLESTIREKMQETESAIAPTHSRVMITPSGPTRR